MLPSLPQRPTALPPSAPIQPTICLLIEPASTISTTSTVASSVTRRPAWNSDLMPSLASMRADLRPAAVHDDRLDAGLLEQHDVLGEILRRGAVAHGVAAVFDDHDLLVVALHVRQGLDEDFGAHMHVGQRVGHRALGSGGGGSARASSAGARAPEAACERRGAPYQRRDSPAARTRSQPSISTSRRSAPPSGRAGAPRKSRAARSPQNRARPRTQREPGTRRRSGRGRRPAPIERREGQERRRVESRNWAAVVEVLAFAVPAHGEGRPPRAPRPRAPSDGSARRRSARAWPAGRRSSRLAALVQEAGDPGPQLRDAEARCGSRSGRISGKAGGAPARSPPPSRRRAARARPS